MSVGKPGYSSVEMSAALSLPPDANADGIGPEDVDACAGFLEFGDDCAEMIWIAIGDDKVAASDGSGDQEGSCFNAVGIDAVACSVQAG